MTQGHDDREVCRRWMRYTLRFDGCEFFDPLTSEPRYTEFAEAAAEGCNLFDPVDDYTIPEWVFEVAADELDRFVARVAAAAERKRDE